MTAVSVRELIHQFEERGVVRKSRGTDSLVRSSSGVYDMFDGPLRSSLISSDLTKEVLRVNLAEEQQATASLVILFDENMSIDMECLKVNGEKLAFSRAGSRKRGYRIRITPDDDPAPSNVAFVQENDDDDEGCYEDDTPSDISSSEILE